MATPSGPPAGSPGAAASAAPGAAFGHEVLAVVLSVRGGVLSVLLWRRARSPYRGRWALPGGSFGADERLRVAITRLLSEKVDVREVAHLEQLATHSDPARDPRGRMLATAYLGVVPTDSDPALPADTAWHPVDGLPPTAFDHRYFVEAGRDRLRAKLSYTNIGFALAPAEFSLAELRAVVSGALGYEVSLPNLTRVVQRRGMVAPTGAVLPPGPSGGRPAALFRFVSRDLEVTDPFAVLRPPKPVARRPAAAVPPGSASGG